MRLHTAVPEHFDQETDGAACVERLAGGEAQDDRIGYRPEEAMPLRGRTKVRQRTAVGPVVIGVESFICSLHSES